MTTTKELEARLAELEAKVTADPPPTPGQQAATDAYGNPGTVVSGELIEAAWGNSVRDHVIKVFPDFATLNATTAPAGAVAEAPAGTFYVRYGGFWNDMFPPNGRVVAAAYSDTPSGPYTGIAQITGLTINMTTTVARFYRITLTVPQIVGTGSGKADLSITDNAFSPIATTRQSFVDSNNTVSMVTSLLYAGTGAIVVRGALAVTAGASALIQVPTSAYRCSLIVQDVGPAF